MAVGLLGLSTASVGLAAFYQMGLAFPLVAVAAFLMLAFGLVAASVGVAAAAVAIFRNHEGLILPLAGTAVSLAAVLPAVACFLIVLAATTLS
jgi:hypothetical protein